jgi:hypothetical protein
MRKLWFRRKAVSTMIGGIIVLALFLTALVAMVVVSQQYDAYQNTVNAMSQKDIDRYSENVTVLYPGLIGNFTVPGCGAGGKCNQYNMTLSNNGGMAVQIVRIYINSTGSGCTISQGLCVLDQATTQTPRAYTFGMSDGFLNVGELFHVVRFWLPTTVALPNQTLTPKNTIWIVTARGRVFTFQWPFAPIGPQGGEGVNPTIQTGLMKIAYNSSSYNSATDACHKEPGETWSVGGSKTLTFVNPWITGTAMNNVMSQDPPDLFVYANTVNSLDYSVTITWGNIILQVANASANTKQYYIGGPLVGIVYRISPAPGVFVPAGTPKAINPGDQFIMIFRITRWNGPVGVDESFSGTVTVNNANPPGFTTNKAQDSSFRALVVYMDGLYVRNGC